MSAMDIELTVIETELRAWVLARNEYAQSASPEALHAMWLAADDLARRCESVSGYEAPKDETTVQLAVQS